MPSYQGGRHSSVVWSTPTFPRPRVRIPVSPNSLFSICMIEILKDIGKGMEWNEKRTKINEKRPGLAHIKNYADVMRYPFWCHHS